MENDKYGNLNKTQKYVYEKTNNANKKDKNSMKEQLKIIGDLLAMNRSIPWLMPKLEDLQVEMNSLEEQISLKEAENIEDEEEDEDIIEEKLEYARIFHEKAEKKVSVIERHIKYLNNKSDALIDRMMEKMHKTKGFPTRLEMIKAKKRESKEIETSKLETIRNMIEDSHQEEISTLDQISNTEKELTDVNNKLVNVQNIIKNEQENNLNLLGYEQRKNLLVEEVKNKEEQIDQLKKTIQEKTEINKNVAHSVNELTKKVQNERMEHDLILTKIQQVKNKNVLLNEKESLMDVEADENLSDLVLSNAYQIEKDNIQKLKDDKVEIIKDMEKTKISKENLQQEFADLDSSKCNDDLANLQNEVVSANKTYESKQKELKKLKKANAKNNKGAVFQNKNMQLLTEEHNKLNSEYTQALKERRIRLQIKKIEKAVSQKNEKSVTQKVKKLDTQNSEKAVTQEVKKSANNHMNEAMRKKSKSKKTVPEVIQDIYSDSPSKASSQKNEHDVVEKWLHDLPQKFKNLSSKIENSSPALNNTVEYDDDDIESEISTSVVDVTASNNLLYKKNHDLDPPNPESIMEESFSDLNNTGSEYWIDDSYLDLNGRIY